MKTILTIIIPLIFIGCSRSQHRPKFEDGSTVVYNVNGITGTGIVVSSCQSTDGWYYVVDAGLDGTGESDRACLHQKMLKQKK